MVLSTSEIDSLKEQEGYPPYTDEVDANSHEHHEIFSDFGNSHGAHNNFAGIEHKGGDDKEDAFCGQPKSSTMRAVFNPQAMPVPQITIVYIDLGGDIGTVAIASESPEKAMEVAQELQELANVPSLKQTLGKNLSHASTNVDGKINATYEDQFADEAKYGTQCSIDTSAEAVIEATTNPNSYAADNFARLNGETPVASQDVTMNFDG